MLPEKYNSRKLFVSLLVLLSSILALFTGHLNGDQFIEIAKWTVGLYGLANVANNVVIPGVGSSSVPK